MKTNQKSRRVPPLGIPSTRRVLARLRKHAPLSAPVRVVYRKGVRSGGNWVLGYARTARRLGRSKKALRYLIVIESRLSIGEKWDTLVHEWAHCLDRGTRRWCKDCHDTRWGQHFSRAFRASLKSTKESA